jgi:hypothetical protein
VCVALEPAVIVYGTNAWDYALGLVALALD